MLEINRKKEVAIETSSLMTYNISKHNKLFSDIECMKQYMVHLAEKDCPENKTAFENVNSYR